MPAVIPVLAILSALAATVLAFIFIVPEKKKAKLNKIGKIAHDICNFKFLIIEKVMQALYIFSTALVVMFGFFLLFYVEQGYQGYYYSSPDRWYGGYGILLMIVGPIAVRFAYEILMMFILLVKNVIQINSKLKSEGGDKDIFATTIEDIKEEVAEPVAQSNVCPVCKQEIEAGAEFCPFCGAKM